MAQLVSTKRHGDRKRALGQQPGKKIRTIGFKPPKVEPPDGIEAENAIIAHIERLRERKSASRLIKAEQVVSSPPVSKRKPTKFERVVLKFLLDHAIAEKHGQILPEIPAKVRKRYSGTNLSNWRKTILKSGLYKQAKSFVAKEYD